MLHITKAQDPITVEHLNICIYGAPGTGKSTLGFSAKRPLLLDFDHGAYRAKNRGDSVQIQNWLDIKDLNEKALKEYDTIIVDTAGRAIDVLKKFVVDENPKNGRSNGEPSQQGYGAIKAKFAQWLKDLNGYGKDVILIAHMDEQRSGDEIIERLDVLGSSKNEIYKSVDAMGRLNVTANGRTLDFNPTSAAYGKNPGQLEVLAMPDIDRNPHFLADVIQKIKDKLNEQTEAQRLAQAEIAEWTENVKALKTAEDFNEAVQQAKDASKAVKIIVANAATSAGMVFDKAKGGYVDATKEDAVA